MTNKNKYVGLTLGPHERIVYSASLHWIMFLAPPAVAALGVVLPANGSMLLQWLRVLIIAYGVLKFGLRLIEWKTTEVVVTNTRVVVKTGLISRQTKEINVSRIESVNVDQSVLGRTFGYGTVTVQGTGGGIAPLAYVAKPLMLRGQLLAEPRTAEEMALRRAIS